MIGGRLSTRGVSRRPIFYGWVLVLVTMVHGAVTSGAGLWGFSVFVLPMGASLGWSRTAMLGALTLRSLLAGAMAPFLGPLQDTLRGPRVLAMASALTVSSSMIAMKWVDDLVIFYLLFGVLGALSFFGSSEMMMTAVLPRWFVRRRGRALGIASMGTAMGPLFFPFLVSSLITAFGWRDAWLVLGVSSLAILVPSSLLVRTRPEDLGLLPDGDAASAALAPTLSESAKPPLRIATERNYTRREVVRLPTFWLLVLAFSLATLGLGGFHVNWLPYFQDIGFTSAQGSLAATAYGVCSISTRLVWGWLAERFPVRYTLALESVLIAVSVLLFLSIDNQLTLILAGAAHGLALGGFFVMRPLAVADYFGRGHLGAVNGILRPFITLSAAASPLLVASARELQGSYDDVFVTVALCWLLAAAIVAFARPPQAQETAAAV